MTLFLSRNQATSFFSFFLLYFVLSGMELERATKKKTNFLLKRGLDWRTTLFQLVLGALEEKPMCVYLLWLQKNIYMYLEILCNILAAMETLLFTYSFF